MVELKQLKETKKRDASVAIEKKYQAVWKTEKIWERDCPPAEAGVTMQEIREKYPKYFGCMAYPYMNGSLHLGHAFSLSKVEFMTRYERMNGKNALFPLGFHCTGMPIKACADKLVREMELFGPNFEKMPSPEEIKALANAMEDASLSNDTANKPKAKKGKVQAKSVPLKYQAQIMMSIGIPRSEVNKFADAAYWLKYFPPVCEDDCTSLGLAIDWRRSFITTDANPFYDSFVRWQMTRLHEMGKIKFGERYTIYSIKDGQPCMDHDRQSGEGLGPQEYTAIKLEVIEFAEAAKEKAKTVETILKGKRIFFIAATLRPETMYGQTCCFVGPKLEYGMFVDRDEAYICTPRAAKNMAYQTFGNRGEVGQIASFVGKDFVGTTVKAPLSQYPQVRILLMETVLASKGTGVVTSVPSDSPDDFATVTELAKKPAYYGIEKEWASLPPVPIISTPTYGDMAAPEIVKRMKIQSPKDTKLLAEAKEAAYREGFYSGTMLIGKYKGEKVEDAKPKVRDDLLKSGEAFVYNEPEGLVMSRSGDECIVALCDQWYLNYGESEWKKVTEKLLGQLNTYSVEARHAFEKTLDWLNQWACARTYGLGSRIPWDPQYLVESLSDSTIYMAYYTIAHLLHSKIDGSELGPAKISPEEMTDEVWDYIFLGKDLPSTSIPKETLQKLRHSFEYWYPLDARVSGKDLINNHLTFFLYNHTALFPEENWPKGIRANGHLMLNGEKMSKSTGNSMTLRESVIKFGADATRVALADAGDGMDDANFEENNADSAVLRLFTEREWCEEQMAVASNMRTEHPYANFFDRAFENEMNSLIEQTTAHYDATNYKSALKTGLFDYQNARSWYRDATGGDMHRDLVIRFIETQALLLAPIAPHWSEYIWRDVLKKDGTIQDAPFPKPSRAEDRVVTAAQAYVKNLSDSIHQAESLQLKKKAKGKQSAFDPRKPKKLWIYVATEFPAWQQKYIDALQEFYDENSNTVDDAGLKKKISSLGSGAEVKLAMTFIQEMKRNIMQRKPGTPISSVLDRTLVFNEFEILEAAVPYIKRSAGIAEVNIVELSVGVDGTFQGKTKHGEKVETLVPVDKTVPGQPSLAFENI